MFFGGRMPKEISATELRKNIYKLLDYVLATGDSIKINRKGRKIIIISEEKIPKLEQLEPHPNSIIGDPEDIVHMDWSKEWNPDL